VNQKTICIISPYARSVILFRYTLIQALKGLSTNIIVLAPDWTDDLQKKVSLLGIKTESYPLKRTDISPINNIKTLQTLYLQLKIHKPDVVLTYQAKPNILGTLAAWLAGIPNRYVLIEGLGFAFSSGSEALKKRLLRAVMIHLYKLSLRKASKVFFLNSDDLNDFLRMKIIATNQGVVLGGIGVDLQEWSPAPPHFEPLTFTLIARLLREKGVLEFVEAARRIKSRYPFTRFLLIGPVDANPGAIQEADVQRWVEEGILEWVPWTDDVKFWLRQTSVYVLPSYYREGVPRSTQEALAMARPVITTDVPGCRETVIHGKNGLLIPPRNVKALVEAMEHFIRNPHLIEQMGQESRRLAEERFDARKFNAKIISYLLEKA